MPRAKKAAPAANQNSQKAANVVGGFSSADFAAAMNKIVSDAGVKQAPPEPKKNDRWEMILDTKTKEAAEKFVGASALLKSVENRVDRTKAEIVSYCSKEITKKIWENKSKPSNPEILLRDSNNSVEHRFIFMCQDRFKVEHPEIPQNADVKEFFINLFVGVGLSHANSEELVENELNFNPVSGIRSLTELLDGYYGTGREWIDSKPEEKQAGLKLAKFLMWDGSSPLDPLEPEEKVLVVKTNPNVVIKAEFFSRVATYCESLEQLEAVLSVIKPVYSVGHIKYAMNDSDKQRIDRTIEIATDILGEAHKN